MSFHSWWVLLLLTLYFFILEKTINLFLYISFLLITIINNNKKKSQSSWLSQGLGFSQVLDFLVLGLFKFSTFLNQSLKVLMFFKVLAFSRFFSSDYSPKKLLLSSCAFISFMPILRRGVRDIIYLLILILLMEISYIFSLVLLSNIHVLWWYIRFYFFLISWDIVLYILDKFPIDQYESYTSVVFHQMLLVHIFLLIAYTYLTIQVRVANSNFTITYICFDLCIGFNWDYVIVWFWFCFLKYNNGIELWCYCLDYCVWVFLGLLSMELNWFGYDCPIWYILWLFWTKTRYFKLRRN